MPGGVRVEADPNPGKRIPIAAPLLAGRDVASSGVPRNSAKHRPARIARQRSASSACQCLLSTSALEECQARRDAARPSGRSESFESSVNRDQIVMPHRAKETSWRVQKRYRIPSCIWNC